MNKLSSRQIEKIKEYLQTQLLKLGYTAPITHMEEIVKTETTGRLEFHTEIFQTTPVIFKSVWVSSFNTAISEGHADNDPEKTFWQIWVTVSVRWESFGRGTNGTGLGTFRCICDKEGLDVYRKSFEI